MEQERAEILQKFKMGLWDQFLSWLQQLKEFLLGFLRSKPTLTLDEEIPAQAPYGKIFEIMLRASSVIG